jgi:hypothetical protein
MAGVVNPGACPISFDPSIDGGAGHPQFHAFRDNRFMQRLAVPFVALTEMNS